jgi:Protein of unknown function (DUF664)
MDIDLTRPIWEIHHVAAALRQHGRRSGADVPQQTGAARHPLVPLASSRTLRSRAPLRVAGEPVGLTLGVDENTEQTMKRDLLDWLDAQRRHVAEQMWAMPPEARRRSYVPSGWTPRGLIRHLTLDVERVWFRAVMAGERVDLPEGYDGWTAPELQSDEELLQQYVTECRLASAAVDGLALDAEPSWWFEDGGDPPYASLRDVLLHVIVETATHAGHLDICRELADGGQRLVLDEPTG